MADLKITELTELTTINDTDVIAVVDNSIGTPTTKKITVVNLLVLWNKFETISKNIRSWDISYIYNTSEQITSAVSTSAESTITKTFNYTGTQLDSIVLSGDTPNGIDLTKTFVYTGTLLTAINYS